MIGREERSSDVGPPDRTEPLRENAESRRWPLNLNPGPQPDSRA
jgi:hypothetical protein